jgi:hypothetical protein
VEGSSNSKIGVSRNNRARDRDSLSLTTGKSFTAFTNDRVVALRHVFDEFMGVSESSGANLTIAGFRA